MKKIFSFVLALTAALVVNAATLKATLDFSSNEAQTPWNLPASSANQKAEASFTNGTYTIKLKAQTKYAGNGTYVLLGKKNSTLTLQAFDFRVSKIVVEKGSGQASESVKQNIFVGDDAVSDETTNGRIDHTYLIASTAREAGTIYTLKVTSDHNTQFSKILIYEEEEGDPEPEIAKKDTVSVNGAVDRIKNNKLGPCYVDGVVDSLELDYLIDGTINIWMVDTTVTNPDTIKAYKILNVDKAEFVAGEDIPFAKGDTIRVLANALMLYDEKVNGTLTGRKINEINEGTYVEKLGVSTAVTPTQPINPDTISVDSALVLLAAGDNKVHIVRGQVKSFDVLTYLSSEGVITEMTLNDVDKPNKTIVAYKIYGGPDETPFAATRKCGLPFELNDTILVLSKSLVDYQGKKEISNGYYVSRDGKEDKPDRCEVCKDKPDTISVDSALTYIALEGYCHQIVKGVVVSHSKEIRSFGAIEEVILKDCDNANKTIKCYNMYGGFDGTDTVKFTAVNQLPFIKGDTIYVYGKVLEEYKSEPQLTKFCYFVGREGGALDRTVIELDNVEVTLANNPNKLHIVCSKDNVVFIDDEEFSRPTLSELSIAGVYSVEELPISIAGNEIELKSGELAITVEDMDDNDNITYSFSLCAKDADGKVYSADFEFTSSDFLDDNPNITSAKAYEIGMALASGQTTSKAYNIYGIFVRQREAWSSYNNHSFYLADSKNLGSSNFQGYRVYPSSKKQADAAVLGDTVVFENAHIYNRNGGIQTGDDDKIYKKVKSADIPKLRDVAAPEKTVSEAISLDATKYYTVAGAVSKVVTDTIYMVLASDTVYAYKAGIEVVDGVVEEGDNIKVKGVVSKKDTKSIIYYGLVVDIVKPTAIPEVLIDRSFNKAVKAIDNGQIVIIKNGVKYNILGGKLR